MGYYYVDMEITNLIIQADKVKAALAAINAMFTEKSKKENGASSSRFGDGVRIIQYAWVNYPEGGFKDILEALEELRYDAQMCDGDNGGNGDIEIVCFTGETLGDDETLWSTLAPYLTDGYIDCRGEEGALWRWQIQNGKLKLLKGHITYTE